MDIENERVSKVHAVDTKVEGRIQAFHELIHVGEPDMQAGDHHSQGYG